MEGMSGSRTSKSRMRMSSQVTFAQLQGGKERRGGHDTSKETRTKGQDCRVARNAMAGATLGVEEGRTIEDIGWWRSICGCILRAIRKF